MKIVSVHAVAFGKLKDVKLNFNDGINVVQNVNGFGKTTMASFIRAMLYGFTYARTKNGSDASHFAPWGSSDKFGGSMVVEHGGVAYRIERFFGATSRQETCVVINEKNNKIVDFGMQPGEYLLGLTADSYDRSAYFPQEAVELSSNDNFDSRLANMVQNSTEDYDKVQQKLREYKKSFRYEKGNGGKIYELERKKYELSTRLFEANAAEHRAAEIDKRLQAIAQEKAALVRKQADCADKLTRRQPTAVQSKTDNGQQSRKPAGSKWLPTVGVLLALAGIAFLALGAANVLGAVAYIVGAIGLALGVAGVAVYATLQIIAKRHPVVTTINNEARAEQPNYADEMRAVAEQLGELSIETGRLTEERKRLNFDTVAIQDEILTVEAQIAEATHRYKVAELVVQTLEQAKENLSASYLPKLCRRCSELLCGLTAANYQVTLDRSFKTVNIRENGQTKSMSEFSRGIREITLLCFRVALAELLYDGEIPFLIIDDAFVNFDEDNFVRATNLLQQVAKRGQVVYFTCHARTGNLLNHKS